MCADFRHPKKRGHPTLGERKSPCKAKNGGGFGSWPAYMQHTHTTIFRSKEREREREREIGECSRVSYQFLISMIRTSYTTDDTQHHRKKKHTHTYSNKHTQTLCIIRPRQERKREIKKCCRKERSNWKIYLSVIFIII